MEGEDATREAEASGSVIPDPTSPYADLGEVDPVNLISFAYQIASGMVSPNHFFLMGLLYTYMCVHMDAHLQLHVTVYTCTSAYTVCICNARTYTCMCVCACVCMSV